ncbi:GNAT family N-acetyltransferase [Cytobacillus spongiae]|uniref:GNAT family N-acetyltransferase n=1 Tax=Cytobacillus spongiae TaxID=2901381 RepID=UPI001F2C4FF9|nr:GNAT family N-acetyltransferase [Cytobacillus spongiae]UII54539.1 GNAT family N-acetyltransferase [Cytobacillus spongiae]
MTLTKSIQVVEYHEGLAAGIAKMWNMSRDSWGGDSRIHTEEEIKRKEENSGNIALYLAVEGDEVVGYCSLCPYKEDVGSLYIPLLNVRPDYHGKKVGKLLVLKALEKTIELNWPRLDLYTWPGNTKAVPLYKKTGFFWEDRDDVTHLMNFIPYVLHTPLLKPIFSELDWYKDSVREIKVQPDGAVTNGFTFYEYEWKKGDHYARVQFERSGRGMRLIETNDLEVELALSDQEVIEDDTVPFTLRVKNKKNTPFPLKAVAHSHERIGCDFKVERLVEDELTITGDCHILHGEEVSIWHTHPTLTITVWIDGEACELKLGMNPKKPAKLKGKKAGNLAFLAKKTHFQVEIQNNFKEAAHYQLYFPEDELLELEVGVFQVELAGNERKTITIPAVIKEFGFYQPTITVEAMKANGTILKYTDKIGIPFKGFGEKFGGETDEFWKICNGNYEVNVRKRDGLITACRDSKQQQDVAFFPLKLGKPFSTEFTKKKPTKVDWDYDHTQITSKLQYDSEAFPGLTLTLNLSLYGEGLLKLSGEVVNDGEVDYEQVFTDQTFYQELSEPVLPIENDVVSFSEKKLLGFEELRSHSFTENWGFFNNEGNPFGFCWSSDSKAFIESWQFHFENELGAIKKGETKTIPPVYLSIGAFQEWEELRVFATEGDTLAGSRLVKEGEIQLEPIAKSDTEAISIKLKNYRNQYLSGNLSLYLDDEHLKTFQFHDDHEQTEFHTKLPKGRKQGATILKGIFTGKSTTVLAEELLLLPGESKLSQRIEEGEKKTYVVNNGCITIKAAPDFFPGIYSMTVKGEEWLDTSYPQTIAKGWWNPWGGGLKNSPTQVSTFSLVKEPTAVEFAQLQDELGNVWSGVSLTTKISEHKDWKGLEFVQYYVMLPDIPVLASYTVINQSGGKDLQDLQWGTDLFLRGEEHNKLKVNHLDPSIEKSYSAGNEEFLIRLKNMAIECEGREEKLYFIHQNNMHAYMNKEVFEVTLDQKVMQKETGTYTLSPMFMFFDQRELSNDSFEKLAKLKFVRK